MKVIGIIAGAAVLVIIIVILISSGTLGGGLNGTYVSDDYGSIVIDGDRITFRENGYSMRGTFEIRGSRIIIDFGYGWTETFSFERSGNRIRIEDMEYRKR
jgi:hypothetical protein